MVRNRKIWPELAIKKTEQRSEFSFSPNNNFCIFDYCKDQPVSSITTMGVALQRSHAINLAWLRPFNQEIIMDLFILNS